MAVVEEASPCFSVSLEIWPEAAASKELLPGLTPAGAAVVAVVVVVVATVAAVLGGTNRTSTTMWMKSSLTVELTYHEEQANQLTVTLIFTACDHQGSFISSQLP